MEELWPKQGTDVLMPRESHSCGYETAMFPTVCTHKASLPRETIRVGVEFGGSSRGDCFLSWRALFGLVMWRFDWESVSHTRLRV